MPAVKRLQFTTIIEADPLPVALGRRHGRRDRREPKQRAHPDQAVGFIAQSVADTESDAVRARAPACENYSFQVVPQGTRVVVDLDITAESEGFMKEAWPKALCEGRGAA